MIGRYSKGTDGQMYTSSSKRIHTFDNEKMNIIYNFKIVELYYNINRTTSKSVYDHKREKQLIHLQYGDI